MPLINRLLAFQEGLRAPDEFMRDLTRAACSDMINMRLTRDGKALRPFPGFKRVYPYSCASDAYTFDGAVYNATPADGASDNQLILTLPPDIVGVANGRLLAIVDQLTSRVVAMMYHRTGSTQDNTDADEAYPLVQGTINRISPHTYPTMVHFDAKTYIFTPFDETRVWNGATLTKLGMRAPQVAPSFKTEGDAFAIICTASAATAPDPSIKLDASAKTLTYYLDYGNTTVDNGIGASGVLDLTNASYDTVGEIVAVTIAATNWDARYISAEETDLVYSAPDLLVNAIDPAAAGANVGTETGAVVTIAAEQDWHVDGSQTPTAQRTLAALTTPNGLSQFNEDGEIKYYHISPHSSHKFAGNLVKIAASGTIDSTHNRVSCSFGWTSAYGPYAYPSGTPLLSMFFAQNADLTGNIIEVPINITLRVGEWRRIEVDITDALGGGSFAYAAVGVRLNMDIPENMVSRYDDDGSASTTHVTFALDSLQTFRSFAHDHGLESDDRWQVAFSWYDSKTYFESSLSPYSDLITMGSGVGFTIDIAGVENGMPNDLWNTPPERADKVRVYTHRQSWDVDLDLGFSLFRRIAEVPIPPTEIASPSNAVDYRRYVRIASEMDEATMLLQDGPAYTHGVPPACRYGIEDYGRLIMAGLPSYKVGRVKLTQDSQEVPLKLAYTTDATGDLGYYDTNPGAGYTASPANTPVWGEWLSGRTVRFGTDARQYAIVKVLDTSGNGTYDTLWISAGDEEKAYIGDTAATSTYEIVGRPTRIYFTSKTRSAIETEAVSPWNYLDLEMPGDEIMGLGHVGPYLIVLGRSHVAYLRQNTQYLDDVPIGSLFPNPRIMEGPGCVSARTVVQLPNRQAMWLSATGDVVLATVEGMSKHPASDSYRGWLLSSNKVDTALLKYAHAVYHPLYNHYILHVIEGAPNTADPWGDFGTEPDIPADHFAGVLS